MYGKTRMELKSALTITCMEPVVCDPSDTAALTAEDLPVVLEQYELLAKEMLERKRSGRPFTFYHYMFFVICWDWG